MQVLKQITSMLSRGVKVYYVTGNHDEILRRFENFSLGDFHIVNKLVIHHDDGLKSWIFHGDVFDVTMKHSKWLAKLGAAGYDTLILINAVINWFSEKLGKGKVSLSKKIKNSVKSAVKFINNFEVTAAEIAIQKGYNYVVCGHIHLNNRYRYIRSLIHLECRYKCSTRFEHILKPSNVQPSLHCLGKQLDQYYFLLFFYWVGGCVHKQHNCTLFE